MQPYLPGLGCDSTMALSAKGRLGDPKPQVLIGAVMRAYLFHQRRRVQTRVVFRLSGSAQLNDRQMRSALQVADDKSQLHAARSLDPRLRRGASALSRPFGSRLESGLFILRPEAVVDFPWRPTAQRHGGPVLVVQTLTRVITRPRSDESVTRGIRCTERKSSYEAVRRTGKVFFVAKSTMMTSGTTVSSRSGCSIRSSAPGCAVRQDRTLRGRH